MAFVQTPFPGRNSLLRQTVPCLYLGLSFLYTFSSSVQTMQPGKQSSFTGGYIWDATFDYMQAGEFAQNTSRASGY